MKVLKRGLAVVVMGGMLLATVPSVAVQGFEKGPDTILEQPDVMETEINLRRAKMRAGTSLKLNLIGVSGIKAEWNSTDESVVSVSKWGWMKALKTGKSVVSATYEGKVYKCWVTVIPANLLPTVTLGNYKGVDLGSGMSIVTSEQFLKDCTFSNITQKDVDDWKIRYKNSLELLMKLVLDSDDEDWCEELGFEEEELDEVLDGVKSMMFREEMAMLAIAEKENILITPENLGTYIKYSLTITEKLDRYEAFMEEVKKNPKQLEEFCKFISVEKTKDFIREHAAEQTIRIEI